MPKLSKLFAGLCFVALLSVLPAAAQMTAIAGTVKGVDGKPLQGATVVFTRTDIAGHYQVKTNKRGHYGHYGLPYGEYNLAVYGPKGEKLYRLNKIHTKYGDPTVIDVNLQKELAKRHEVAAQMQQQMAANAPVQVPKGMSKADAEKYKKALEKQQAEIKKIGQLNQLLKQNKAFADAGQWDQAIKTMQEAVAMDQTHDVLFASLGQDLVGGKQYAPAVDAYKKAIALKPTDPSYYINLGNAYSHMGQNDLAAAQFAKAAQLDPANAKTAYLDEAVVFYNGGKSDEALAAAEKLLTIDPNNAMGWYLKGQILLAKAAVDPKTGTPIPVPGTKEAYEKYLQLAPTGQFAPQVKAMLQTLNGTVETNFKKSRHHR